MGLATQNPREHAGTYPLPESQLDRFLLRVRVGYPAAGDEKVLLRGETAPSADGLGPVVSPDEVLALQDAADRVKAEESVLDYLLAIVTATRQAPLLAHGVSPRGSLALLRAARARALCDGRDFLVPDDVKLLAEPALAHRIIARGGGDGSALGAEAILRSLLPPGSPGNRNALDQAPQDGLGAKD